MTLRIIGGEFKGRVIKVPKTTATRPTQGALREAIFNICQHEIGGASFLDVFAGSGAMGLEALSRGAHFSTFIEQNRVAIRSIQLNIQAFDVEERSKVLGMDAKKAIEKLQDSGKKFDIIYIDPPYGVNFDLSLMIDLLEPHSSVFVEIGQKQTLDIPEPLTLKKEKQFGAAQLKILVRK